MRILLASRNNIYQSTDGGSSWNKLFEVPLNYLVSDITYTADSSILCGISNYKNHGLYRYNIRNTCLTQVLPDAAESHPLITTESDSVLFAIGYRGNFYRSEDFGKNWRLIAKCTIPESSAYSQYYVCSGNSCMINGHRRFIFGFVIPSRIIITDDTGRTWRIAAEPRWIENGPLPQIAKGNSEGEFFCCANNNVSNNFYYSVLHSNDFGTTWEVLKSPSSLWSIIVDHTKEHHCIVGSFMVDKRPDEQSPVYESYDAGKNWNEVGKLPSAFIWNLACNTTGTNLYAATSGGLYTYSYLK